MAPAQQHVAFPSCRLEGAPSELLDGAKSRDRDPSWGVGLDDWIQRLNGYIVIPNSGYSELPSSFSAPEFPVCPLSVVFCPFYVVTPYCRSRIRTSIPAAFSRSIPPR